MDVDILERINHSSLRFLQALTLQETFAIIIEEAIKLVGGDGGYLALSEEGSLVINYAYPISLADIKMRKNGFSYTAYIKRKAFVTSTEDFKNIHPELIKAGIQSTIFIPLSYKSKSIGVMNIMSKQISRKFSQKELSILKLFGSMASLAIRKAQLYAETKSALDNRNLFLSMSAHEFRTPITTISGYAQLLKSKIKTDSPEKKWSEEIYIESQRLTRLVNELLEVNRISSGEFQYNFHECNVFKILDQAVAAFKLFRPKRQIIFNATSNIDGIIIGDDDKLMQVFINILDNADKFSPIDKKIEVRLKDAKHQLIIQIKDYGQGIARQDLPRVFEGYYRGSNNTKEGMGLGLYLSYQVVKRHKGEILIKSKVGQGTTVEIRFPRTIIDQGMI